MAVTLPFGAMAHQGDRLAFCELLKEAEGEFLPVVLDRAIAAVNGAAFKQFFPITTIELGPGYLAIQERA